MSTEGRRIENKSVGLKEPRQNDPKKIMPNFSPTNFEYKPRGLVVENNNVYKKRYDRKYILFLTI